MSETTKESVIDVLHECAEALHHYHNRLVILGQNLTGIESLVNRIEESCKFLKDKNCTNCRNRVFVSLHEGRVIDVCIIHNVEIMSNKLCDKYEDYSL